jgi:hypothetical protein
VLTPVRVVFPEDVTLVEPPRTADTLAPSNKVTGALEVSVPEPVTLPEMLAPFTVCDVVPKAKVAPLATVSAPLPMLSFTNAVSVPAEILVFPESVFAPESTTLPEVVMFPVPFRIAETFAPVRPSVPTPRFNVPEP